MAAATLLLAPGLSWAVGPLFAIFILAELVFTLNAMLYLFTESWEEPFNWKTATAAIAFNSTCNAAITKDSTKQFTFLVQSLGFVLSGSIMTKSVSGFISNFWNNSETEWPNVYNAVFFVEHLVAMSATVLLINTMLMPLIIPAAGVLGSFCIGTILLALVFMLDQAIDIYSSKFGKDHKIEPLITKQDETPSKDISAKKAAESKPATRTPLIISALPQIGLLYSGK